MKLLRLKLGSRFRSLPAGFEFDFCRSTDFTHVRDFSPYCMVGRNGSGKSNILEALAAIFYHIECTYLENVPENFTAQGDFDRIHTDGFFSQRCDPDAFELEYLCLDQDNAEQIGKQNPLVGSYSRISIKKEIGQSPILTKYNTVSGVPRVLSRSEVKTVLPDYVIGYSSGENEILSLPFFKMRFIHYDEYEDALFNQTPYANPEGRLIYLDFQHSQAVFLTNFLMQDETVLQPLYDTVGIKSMGSFRMIIDIGKEKTIKQEALLDWLDEESDLEENELESANITELLIQQNPELTDIKVIDKLRRCATLEYHEQRTGLLYLDFFVDDDTRDDKGRILKDAEGEEIGLSEIKKSFRTHFDKDPFELFRAFQILLTLNLYTVDNKTKREVYHSDSIYVTETIPTPPSDHRIFRFKDFIIYKDQGKSLLSKSLSDGEYQYLHAIGLFLLFRNSNSLFLLDEPETHFNPDWRAKFISTLRDCLKKDHQLDPYLREILITSHSPFIVSDSVEENVLVFKKDAKGTLSVRRPSFQTFGASVGLITMELFERIDTIGDLASEKILEFERRIDAGEDLDKIKEEIFQILGDSVERTMLINHLINKRENP